MWYLSQAWLRMLLPHNAPVNEITLTTGRILSARYPSNRNWGITVDPPRLTFLNCE